MYRIYLIINLINNKKYVGQTEQTIRERWKKHYGSLKTGFPIHNAIKKYGKNNFVISEIDCVESVDKANYKEVFWGLFYDALSPTGYNLKLGGREVYIVSEETKKKISIANTGKTPSPEARAKFKIARSKWTIPPEAYIKAQETRDRTHPNHYSDGGKKAWEAIRASGRTQTTTDKTPWQTEEFRNKCKLNVIKRSNETGKLFICNETQKTFRNTGECARQMNLPSYKCVWKCLKNKLKSYCGFTFSYV